MSSSSTYRVHSVTDTNMRGTLLARAGVASSSPAPRSQSSAVPVAVSKSQAYYWKHSWQEAERKALAELEAGKGRKFNDAAAAIRYLLGPDDDE